MKGYAHLIKLTGSQWLPFLLGLTGLYLFMIVPYIGSNFEYLPGDLGDGRFNHYILEHGFQYFTGKINDFWNAPFMFPEKNVITYSDNLLGTQPLYSFFRALTQDAHLTYQLWIISLVVLNYSAAFLLFRALFKNAWIAFFCSLIFCFSHAVHIQMAHLQMLPKFPIPLAFYFLFRFCTSLSTAWFALASLSVVYQFYCAIYLGFLLIIPFGIVLLLIMFSAANRLKLAHSVQIKDNISLMLSLTDIFRRNFYKKIIHTLQLNFKWTIIMGLTIVGSLLLLLPIMLPYMERAALSGTNSYEAIYQTIPTLQSYFFSHFGSESWKIFHSFHDIAPAWWDHIIFPGGIVWLLTLTGMLILLLKKNTEPFIKILATCGLLTLVIFMRFGDYSLYRIIMLIPGFGSMRSLTRIINVEMLFFALMVGITLKTIITSLPTWKSGLVIGILLLLYPYDNNISHHIHRFEVAESKNRLDELEAKIPVTYNGKILSYEPNLKEGESFHLYHLDAMLVAQKLGIKTLNAYTGNCPPEYAPLWANLNPRTRKEWIVLNEIDSVLVISINELMGGGGKKRMRALCPSMN